MCRISDGDRGAVHEDFSAVGRIDAEHEPRHLCPARAEKTRDADNLTLMHRERDRGHAARASQVAERDPCCPARGIGDTGHMVIKRHILAQHHPHHIGGGQSGQRLCRDLAPVAQDGHAIGKLKDLIQKMRDEDDAKPARLEVAHDIEKPLHLVPVKAGGRLVQHQHLAREFNRARDGNDLLNGDGVFR